MAFMSNRSAIKFIFCLKLGNIFETTISELDCNQVFVRPEEMLFLIILKMQNE